MNITIFGLGAMGLALAHNMKDAGFNVSGYDVVPEARDRARESGITVFDSTNEFVNQPRPRTAWIMVPSSHVDEVLSEILAILEEGDVLIEGGNSNFHDTERRSIKAENRGIHFLGVGVSGGRAGARNGPSLMPGGTKEGYHHIIPLLSTIAARFENEPCVGYLGRGGAGHYVKMIHNGIEYAIMQAMGEALVLLQASQMPKEEIAKTFEKWSQDPLTGGYLTEITADILTKNEGNVPAYTLIKSVAKQKGTGRWAAQEAMEAGVGATLISTAVNQRLLSGYNELFKQETHPIPLGADQIHFALQTSIILSYAQGFDIIQESSYDFDPYLIAKIWRAGCIIRSPLLQNIADHFQTADGELMSNSYLKRQISTHVPTMRAVIVEATKAAIPTPAMTSTLNYFDTRNTTNAHAQLLMAQRDYFGSHGYERVDKPGTFNRDWTTGKETKR